MKQMRASLTITPVQNMPLAPKIKRAVGKTLSADSLVYVDITERSVLQTGLGARPARYAPSGGSVLVEQMVAFPPKKVALSRKVARRKGCAV